MSKPSRFMVLGIDGMDPEIFRFLHKKGKMPVLGTIADAGNFRFLATSNPPQSPVSWTNIATGSNSGTHGICDFIHRDPKTYIPELSLFGIQQHKGGVKYTSHIQIPSVFEEAMKQGIPVTLLRWPLTFPAPESLPSNSRLLSGMGVPDLLGTLGRYSFYTADDAISEKTMHGRIVHITQNNGLVKTEIFGPRYMSWKGMKEASVPLTMERTSDGLKVELPEITLDLKCGGWSPHIILRFSIGLMGKVSAITRMVCIDSEPFPSLFILPMQIYPKETTLPLSSPKSYGSDLWDKIGPYLTLGMPEDTNGLKDGLISEEIFLALCDDVFTERERMLNTALDSFDTGMLACVFDTLDRVQHMFWKKKDGTSNGAGAKEPSDAIAGWYIRMDNMVGSVIERIGETPLVILSDHGFTSLNRYVHLNSWLARNGFLVLKDKNKGGGPLFDNVDWTKTRAYAIGFNSIYLNLKGREGKGIVEANETEMLYNDLIEKLESWVDENKPVIKKVYKSRTIYDIRHSNSPDLIVGYTAGYRASKQTVLGEAPEGALIEDNYEAWSGDHCCDPSFVPGVLFGVNLQSNKINMPDDVSVDDVSTFIKDWLKLDKSN
ncbi:MAG: alkaline phosphatase family protein [Nitrospirae bacterium]|nr:alkaline phosphatase family protein [Nitrospirota bacterium]